MSKPFTEDTVRAMFKAYNLKADDAEIQIIHSLISETHLSEKKKHDLAERYIEDVFLGFVNLGIEMVQQTKQQAPANQIKTEALNNGIDQPPFEPCPRCGGGNIKLDTDAKGSYGTCQNCQHIYHV